MVNHKIVMELGLEVVGRWIWQVMQQGQSGAVLGDESHISVLMYPCLEKEIR